MKKDKDTKNEPIEPPPNYKFVGDHLDASAKNLKPGEEGFMPYEPITHFTDGSKRYKLPPPGEQSKAAFYFDGPPLNRLFGHLYKAYVEKGA